MIYVLDTPVKSLKRSIPFCQDNFCHGFNHEYKMHCYSRRVSACLKLACITMRCFHWEERKVDLLLSPRLLARQRPQFLVAPGLAIIEPAPDSWREGNNLCLRYVTFHIWHCER